MIYVALALLAKARRLSLPATLRLHADFELSGVCDFARQFGVRHIGMGSVCAYLALPLGGGGQMLPLRLL